MDLLLIGNLLLLPWLGAYPIAQPLIDHLLVEFFTSSLEGPFKEVERTRFTVKCTQQWEESTIATPKRMKREDQRETTRRRGKAQVKRIKRKAWAGIHKRKGEQKDSKKINSTNKESNRKTKGSIERMDEQDDPKHEQEKRIAERLSQAQRERWTREKREVQKGTYQKEREKDDQINRAGKEYLKRPAQRLERG